MKVVAIVGSPRLTGNTNYLVAQALKEIATRGFQTETIALSQYRVNPCLGHENCASFSVCKQDDDTAWILEKFSNADAVILGSPVYYYNVTAQMKAFIDRNYFLYTHERRLKACCAGLIAIGGGGGTEHTIEALRQFLDLSADIPDDRIITLTGYASKLGEAKSNPVLVDKAREFGRQIAGILASVHSSP